MTASDLIAAYGAIVATLVAGWTIRKDFAESGRLKIHVMYGIILDHMGVSEAKATFTITNVGMKPVMVRSFAGFQIKSDAPWVVRKFPRLCHQRGWWLNSFKHFVVPMQGPPALLNPQEYRVERVENEALEGGEVHFFFDDSTLHRYYAPRKAVERVLEQHLNSASKGEDNR